MPLKITLMLWLISGIAHGDDAERAVPIAPGIYIDGLRV